MKEVKLQERDYLIPSEVEGEPIVAFDKFGDLLGYVVKDEKGWIVKTGGVWGAYGHCESLEMLIDRGKKEFALSFYSKISIKDIK